MPRYSAQFRNRVLKKLLPPESRSALSVAREYNLSVGTLYGCKARMHDGTLRVEEGVLSNRGRQRAEKLSLLLESRSVAGEAMGEWLRRRRRFANKSVSLSVKRRRLQRQRSSSRHKKKFCDVSGHQGRLIPEERRIGLCETIDEGVKQGVRVAPLCDALGVHPRTYARWKVDPTDRRKGSRKQNPRALSAEERRQIIEVCTSERFKGTPPGEIVAILAEEGTYIASERTFYRVLKAAGLVNHRTNSRPARRCYQPPELKATGPDQVYTWDITWLPSDNGNPMRGATFSVWLATLGMFLSHSRPLVKNDNPYNLTHRHSGLGYITPEQRRLGEDLELFAR